jgi:nucleoside-diphosphate kinase
MNNNSLERTLSIIKPDAVERELETKIKKIFLDNKLNIVESKKIQISKEEAEDFYRVHQTKPFYEKLCSYLSSGPIIVMILDGENAIQKNRDLMGATDPQKAKDGTIRKIYGISIDKNSVHGSDSPKNAEVEINFFFN